MSAAAPAIKVGDRARISKAWLQRNGAVNDPKMCGVRGKVVATRTIRKEGRFASIKFDECDEPEEWGIEAFVWFRLIRGGLDGVGS